MLGQQSQPSTDGLTASQRAYAKEWARELAPIKPPNKKRNFVNRAMLFAAVFACGLFFGGIFQPVILPHFADSSRQLKAR